MARRKKIKVFPAGVPVETEQDLVGRVPVEEDLPEAPEITLPPSASTFPAVVEGGIHDPMNVLKLAFMQMTIEKLRAQITSYRISFENQIRELTMRKTTMLAQLQQELTIANDKYLNSQKEIEEQHGIKLEEYTFNPDNGMFNRVIDPSKKLGEVADTSPPR